MALTKTPLNEEIVSWEKHFPNCHQLATDVQLLEMFSAPIVEPLTRENICSSGPRTPHLERDIDNLDVHKDELFEVNKLLQALDEFGLKPSTTQLIELQNKLSMNCNRLVRFGDFVEVVKDVFHEDLIDKTTISGVNASSFKFCIHNLSLKSRTLELENSVLRNEIRILKHQLKSMENACSCTEDELLATRKELQNCIECIRKLKDERKIKTRNKISGAADCEHRLKSCVKHETVKAKEINPATYKENTRLKEEIKRLHTSNSLFKATSYKLINFLEDLQSQLMELLDTPRNKVGRSFSLYRNIACGSGVRCNGAVARAASVCTPVKGGNLQCQMKQNHYDTLVEMAGKMKEILAVSKDMVKSECHRNKINQVQHQSFNPLCLSSGFPFKNQLHDLLPKTTITIMSKV